MFFDITAQKELEAELRGYRDHLEKLVAERTLALKLADEQLRESEVRFRKIFLESPIGIGLRDLEGFFLESNPALERILGYSGEELRRLSFDQLIHPDDEPRREKLFQDLMEGRRDFYGAEFRFFHKDGSLRWNHVHVYSEFIASPGTGSAKWELFSDMK